MPKRVLIIDDDEGVRGLLSVAVQREGYDADGAQDGDEALEKISKSRYDLVITDLMLPRVGGFEVIRRMQGGDSAAIPVIVITGRYTDAATAEIIRREVNVADFFAKPIQIAALAKSLHHLLGA